MALERNKRKTKPGREDVPLNGRLEMIAMCGNNPAGIVRSLDEFRRYRVARQPELHWIVVDGIGCTENFGARIGGIFVRADKLQECPGARLTISMQDVLHGRTAIACLAEGERLGAIEKDMRGGHLACLLIGQ